MTVAHNVHATLASTRMRLSLQTLFHPIHRGRSHTHSKSHRSQSTSTSGSTTAGSPSSLRSSPSSTFSLSPRRTRPQMPPNSPVDTPDAVTPGGRLNLRRQPSAIDVALQEEAHSPPAEVLGLGLLEPRPRANTGSSTSSSSSSVSWLEFMHETEKREVVLDGIMEVLERA